MSSKSGTTSTSMSKTSSPTVNTPSTRDMPNDPELEGKAYYHGKIHREHAECLLENNVGQFLVRYAALGRERGYAISTNCRGKVRHFKINYDNKADKFYVSRLGPQCNSVHELIHDGYVTERRSLVPLENETEGVYLKDVCERSRWDIDRSKVKLDKKLGAGEFGEVFKGTFNDQIVAVKKGKKKTDHGGVDVQGMLEKEAMFSMKLNHENIVKTIGIVRSKGVGGPNDSTMIIFEFCSNGELRKFLRTKRDELKKDLLVSFATNTVSGMAYLESKKIIHRDVATRNCLLSESLVVKICDFGMAEEGSYKMAKGMAPLRWMAPESIKYGHFTGKSDVWSFGVLLWEIWSFGKEPYGRMEANEIKKFLLTDKHRLSPPSGMPTNMSVCMAACWAEKPSQRPSFKILMSKMFNNTELTAAPGQQNRSKSKSLSGEKITNTPAVSASTTK